MVSVIMTTYNEKLEWIEESLNSLLAQSYRNIEIIIVVDRPDDANIIALLHNYQRNYPHITVIVNEKNIGLARSLNKAFKFSSGVFLARMDADDISKPTRIEKQIQTLYEHPEIQLVSSNCEYIDENGEIIGQQNIGSKSEDQIRRGLKYINFLIHPSWLMRREVYEQLNGYREFECSQDYDFLLRMISHNFKIALSEQRLIKYRQRRNSLSSSRGFKQYLISKYIKKLHLEREKTGNDSFSLESLNLYLAGNQISVNDETFNNSLYKFIALRDASSKILKVKGILRCLFFSVYSRDLLINSLLFKIVVKI
nr:glycosyltransferase [Paenibacillus sacheonensis]